MKGLAAAGAAMLVFGATGAGATTSNVGVDTRAFTLNGGSDSAHYYGYDDGFGEFAVNYSGTSTSRSGTDTATFPGGVSGPLTFTDSYYASASLRDGKLRARASASTVVQIDPVSGTRYVFIDNARASASLRDTIHFHVSPTFVGDYVTIGFKTHIDGSYVAADPSNEGYAEVTLSGTATDKNGQFLQRFYGVYSQGYRFDGNPSHLTIYGLNDLGRGWFGTSISVYQQNEFSVDFLYGLTANTSGGAIDYSHTAAFAFDLPTGVTYTSDSGVFLKGGTTSVPEPAPIALAALGLGCTIVARRRTRPAN